MQSNRFNRRLAAILAAAILAMCRPALADSPPSGERHFLYVAAPGIRNYLEFGGAGILVFDMDKDQLSSGASRRRPAGREKPDNIKGVCACAAHAEALLHHADQALLPRPAHRRRRSGRRPFPAAATAWRSRPTASCCTSRPSRGRTGTSWMGPPAMSSPQIEPKSGAHNTVCGLDGKRMYLAGLKSPLLPVVDPTHAQGRPTMSGRSAPRSGRSRSTPPRRFASSTSTACSASRSAT